MSEKNYRGVQYNRRRKLYEARVESKGIVYNCGSFKTPEAAAKARDIKIITKGLPQKLQILKPVEKNGDST